MGYFLDSLDRKSVGLYVPESHVISVVSLVAGFFTDMDRSIAQGVELLRPIIENRFECLQEYGKEGTEMPVRGFPFVRSDCGAHS